MKNIIRPCFIFVVFAFASCQWGVPPKKMDETVKDTLTYTYKIIHERAADCGSKPDNGCTIVKISYPVFDSAKTLNNLITINLANLFPVDKKADSSIEQMTKNFLRSYTDFRNSDPKSAMFYTLNSYAKVIYQDSSLTTLEIGGYIFQGGAHGSSLTTFVNWDIKAKKKLTLDDIFAAGYDDELNAVAEKIFRKNEKLSDTASLARDYFFKDGKFALNNNFSVTPIGIRFLYNQYEIKPYAAGITGLFIPYSSIKHLLRPNTVISQYIK